MKKLNKNIILFVVFTIIVIVGIYGECFQNLLFNTINTFSDVKNGHVKSAISNIKEIDSISSKHLLYHDTLIDINSVKNNITNMRYVPKLGSNTVKCESDMLSLINEKQFDKEHLRFVANRVSELQKKSESVGADFIYLAVPEKGYYQNFPSNIRDYSKVNFDNYLDCLKENNVPALSYVDEFKKRSMDKEDIYYYTDTHWTTNVGLLAAQIACDSINQRYGIEFDRSKLDINNYNQKLYPDWFLGALGKKVGTYFTWKGADDFNLITPKFKTSLKEEKPYEDSVRKGSFEDTILYGEQIYEKNYYHHDPYSGYCGGNHRLQIFKNQLENNGKTALFIRDSFSHVVTPYFALQFKELHVVDTRGDDIDIYDEKVDWYKYMEELKTDVVIVLYKGVPYETMLDFKGQIQ
ncbi:DHHW protein [Ruminococcaceae bacterium P7]|nr:DHHW protein [Ruminococcaceae bacterium P7]